jgi:hypothetical protein
MLSSVKPVYRPVLLVSLLLLSFAGCSKEAVKPSEDNVKIRAVLSFVNRLKQTYEAKDQSGLLALVSPDSALAASLPATLVRDFQSFDRINFTPSVDRIEMAKDKTTVVLNWDGQWQNGTNQPAYKEKGTTILKLKESPAILLLELSGDPLFGAANRRSQTSPGSPQPSNRLNP